MSLREKILQCDDLPRHQVEVPEWGEVVWVKTLTAEEFFQLRAWWEEDPPEDNMAMTAKTVVMGAMDGPLGGPVFTREDVPALKGKAGVALSRLFAEIAKLNGLREQDVEAIRKNLPAAPSASSSSSSQTAGAAPSPNCSPASAPAN